MDVRGIWYHNGITRVNCHTGETTYWNLDKYKLLAYGRTTANDYIKAGWTKVAPKELGAWE